MNVSLTEQDLVNIKLTVLTLERQEIARNIDPRRFFGHLRAKYIFDERDCDEIRSVSSRIGSAEAFVDILKRKGAKGYDEFCAALMTDRTQLFLLQQMTQTLEQLRARVLDKKKEIALSKSHVPTPPTVTIQQGGTAPTSTHLPLSQITYARPPQIGPRPPFHSQPPHPPTDVPPPPRHMYFPGNTTPLPESFQNNVPPNNNNNTGNNTITVNHSKPLRKVHSRTSNSDEFPEQYTRQSSFPFAAQSFNEGGGVHFINPSLHFNPSNSLPVNTQHFNAQFNPSNTQFNPAMNAQFTNGTHPINTQFINPATNTIQFNNTHFNSSQFSPGPPVFSPPDSTSHFNPLPDTTHYNNYSFNRSQSSPTGGYPTHVLPTQANLTFRPPPIILDPSNSGNPTSSLHPMFGGVQTFNNYASNTGNMMMGMDVLPQGQQHGLVSRGIDENEEINEN